MTDAFLDGDRTIERPGRPTASSAEEIGATSWGSATSRGLVRPSNDDAVGELAPWLFAVADGMGGADGGGVAAQSAVAAVRSIGPQPFPDWPTAMLTVNRQVRVATRGRSFGDAGTTLVTATVVGGLITVINIGDSRAYLVADDELRQLTTDHTVEAELLAHGVDPSTLGADGVAARDGLTRFIGQEDDAAVADIVSLLASAGQRLLLTTDGIHRYLNDEEIWTGARSGDVAEAAQNLVSLADEKGGHDNATTMVIELGVGLPTAESAAAVSASPTRENP